MINKVVQVLLCCCLFSNVSVHVWAQNSRADRVLEDSVHAQMENARLDSLEAEKELVARLKLDSIRADSVMVMQKTDSANEAIAKLEQQIDVSIRINSLGAGVAPFSDTLFYIYGKEGRFRPNQRARLIAENISTLFLGKDFIIDSLQIDTSHNMVNIMYGSNVVIMTVLSKDAEVYQLDEMSVASLFQKKIQDAVTHKRSINFILILLRRIASALLIVVIIAFMIWIIQFGYRRIRAYIHVQKSKYLKDINVKGYTILTTNQETRFLLFFFGFLRWSTIILLLYLTLPIVFSIFPYTHGWADYMFSLVWHPAKDILGKLWNYLPDFFSIVITIIVIRYVLRFIRYVFGEVGSGKLEFKGFHPDWAMPTYNIVKFLLYAFTLVIIFPKLPGASSKSFQGISVFLGLLVSLGSSSAISNIVAGLVITYMRPFKVGDRIMLGNISGDVLEKSLLVTRLKTIKNEEITIPNSAILSGNTINYSTFSKEEGLIVHTTVTIGYDVPWKKMYGALVEAALRTQFVEKTPQPFVLQTSLDDFYVAYQINVYTKEANRRAVLLSLLHQNIQDVCRDNGIEIMSPHYRAERDGSEITIPHKEEVVTPVSSSPIKTDL